MPAKVLVIEDNPTNLQLMLYLLKAFGHTATAVGDGLSGLQAVQEDEFDIVLCDVLMPGIDGWEFARRYKGKKDTRKAPLIAVTALAMVGDRERLLNAGFDGYVSKPIDPEHFIGQIEVFLPDALRSSPAGKTEKAASPKASGAEGLVILAVDDVQINIDLVRSTLQPFGYRIVEAHNVREGLEKAAAEKPAVILCDLHMAGGDGFELLAGVKRSSQLHDVPFFFLSSTAWRTSEQIRGMQLGARKFLLRPIDPETLRREVESAIAEGDVQSSRR
jgi:two-component system cell cycle response regulator